MEGVLVADMQQDSTAEAEKAAWEIATGSLDVRRAAVISIREGVRYGGRGPGWEMSLLGNHWRFQLNESQPSEKDDVFVWDQDKDATAIDDREEKAAAQLGTVAKFEAR